MALAMRLLDLFQEEIMRKYNLSFSEKKKKHLLNLKAWMGWVRYTFVLVVYSICHW